MTQYKYDLEILTPVSLKGVYSKRLHYFLKNGLRNFRDHKVLINLLIGTESFPELEYKFPANVEVRKVKSEVCHHAAKVYDFYSNYNFDQSKWIMRIDDDSITDIDRIVGFLSDLDCEKCYYFVGHLYNNHMSNGDIELTLGLLEKYGKLEKLKEEYSHEVEVAIYSNGTFKKVLEENRKEILGRSKIEVGYTDQFFCFLSKICGIFPSPVSFLSSEPDIQRFIEGSLAHIHKIAPDRNQELLLILDRILQQEPTSFSGSSFAYLKEGEFQFKTKTTPETKIILLNDDGTISCKDRIEEKYWTFCENNLVFYDHSGKKMFEFINFDVDKKNESSGSLGKSYLKMIGF
jgi:hypothetical protein